LEEINFDKCSITVRNQEVADEENGSYFMHVPNEEVEPAPIFFKSLKEGLVSNVNAFFETYAKQPTIRYGFMSDDEGIFDIDVSSTDGEIF
jgi:hypothetical protein